MTQNPDISYISPTTFCGRGWLHPASLTHTHTHTHTQTLTCMILPWRSVTYQCHVMSSVFTIKDYTLGYSNR